MTQPERSTTRDREFSVYVHVPYCRVQCPYCTFYTVARPKLDAVMQPFLDAVVREWRLRVVPRLQRGERLVTLYLGGGTPSDLPARALLAALRDVASDLPGGIAGLREATVECNPESASPELLDGLIETGVRRVSLGVQALDDRDLRTLGRGCDATQNRAALQAVSRRFETWNADLILGIPGSDGARLERALAELHAGGAPHLSFYCLEMPPERARMLGDPQTAASEDAKADRYELASRWVESHGYEHYEISNAARPGCRAVHNSLYWQGGEYVGLGPGAHSFESGVRRANRPDLGGYLEALRAGREPPAAHETLTDAMRAHEKLMLALRQREGLARRDDLLVPHPALLADLVRRGLAHADPDRLRLTAKGWLVSDAIVLQLLAA